MPALAHRYRRLNKSCEKQGTLRRLAHHCIFWTIVGTDSDASWAVILIDRGH